MWGGRLTIVNLDSVDDGLLDRAAGLTTEGAKVRVGGDEGEEG